MTESLTPTITAPAGLTDRVRAVGPALSDGFLDRDRRAEFSHENWRILADTGIFRGCIPVEYGGYGGSILDLMHAVQALGQVSRDAGANFSAATHLASTGVALTAFGSPTLKAAVLPDVATGSRIGAHAITEPNVGSDVVRLQSTGRLTPDTIVLSGEKTYVTNGPIADLIVVYVRTGEAGNPFSLTAVLLDRGTPGLRIGPALEKNTLRTSPFSTLSMSGCEVPRSQILGSVGLGLLILDHVMTWEILLSFVINVGEMQHRLDRVVEQVKRRQQFSQPLAKFQGVQNTVADMYVAVETARLALYSAAEEIQAGHKSAAAVAMAKILASEANLRTAQLAVELFGGSGVLTETGLEIGVRDALGGSIYSGTNAIQRQKIAKSLGL